MQPSRRVPPGCPPLDQIFDVLRGGETAADDAEVRAHLARCARCGETAAWLDGYQDAASEGRLGEPPAETVGRAIALFPPPDLLQT